MPMGFTTGLPKNNPPTAKDFLTPEEMNTLRDRPECLRRGLSVLRTRQDAIHQRRAFKFLGKYIAEGILDSGCGKTRLTPTNLAPTHTTWWCYEGVNRSQRFRV